MEKLFIIYSLVAGSFVFAFIHKHFRMMYFGFKAVALSWMFTCFMTGAVTVVIFGSIIEKFKGDDTYGIETSPDYEITQVESGTSDNSELNTNEINIETKNVISTQDQQLSFNYIGCTLSEIKEEFGSNYVELTYKDKPTVCYDDDYTYNEFIFNELDDNSKIVGALFCKYSWSVMGITTGADSAYIEQVLGEPYSKGFLEENDQLYMLEYHFSNGILRFYSDDYYSPFVIAEIEC